jgi:hypothetical protein
MAGIIYLDVDDEITSAAARIRTASELRLAIVVPPGSRVSTSRINFRLLAREALERNRRLSIVAPDAASRSLAASAGLPVFSSVGDYEASPEARPGDAGTATNGSAASAPDENSAEPPAVAERLDASETVAVSAAPTVIVEQRTRPIAVPARASVGPVPAPAERPGPTLPRLELPPVRLPRALTRFGLGRTGLAIVAAVLALVLLVGGVTAFVFLPSARVVVTPQAETIGPISLTVRAQPGATAVDTANGIVPAERLTFELRAGGEFPATGRRVERTTAAGSVTFRSKDPVRENSIAAGAIVATTSGVKFRTLQAITLPKATIVGLQIIESAADVAIEAVGPGPGGNVPANTIVAIPPGEDPNFTSVFNPAETQGGSREEFPRVEQKDVDDAVASLQGQIESQFQANLADPTKVPAGKTLFEATRELGASTPTGDPAALVGQEIETFSLELVAPASVTVVDESPVAQVAETRLRTSVRPGHDLVADSINIGVGEPTVEGAEVTFPVTASARQLRRVDATDLREAIKGKPIEEARRLLGDYGQVDLEVWPAWVGSIPTFDFRLELSVEQGPPGQPSATSAPSMSPGPSEPVSSASPAASDSPDPGP